MLKLFRHVNGRFSTLRLNKYKNIVTISERANKKLEDIIGSSGRVVYLRLTLKGCNGYTYDMKLREMSELGEMDERVYGENGKLLLVIENKASFYLLGSHIDHQTTELSDGFTFNNPNIISVCGCGQSFQLNNNKEAE